MTFTFESFGEFEDNYTITIQLGNTITQKMQLPGFIARTNFESLVYQAAKYNSKPFKVTCYKKEYIDDGKELNNSLSFENNAFIEAFGGK